MFFVQDAILDLHGRGIDPGSDFQSEPNWGYRGGTHACADTDFRGFIATPWPADGPLLPGDKARIWIFILKYMKNSYGNIILK